MPNYRTFYDNLSYSIYVEGKNMENNIENEISNNKFKTFFKSLKENLMTTTNGMAIGLFGTLIIGTILDLFAQIPGLSSLSSFTSVIKGLMGAGIGLGVALSLKKNGVIVVASMAAGLIGNYAYSFTDNKVTSIGDPLSCYISAVLCLLAIKYIMRKKTPVDIILLPLVGLICSLLYSYLLANYVHYITIGLGWVIEKTFSVVPFLMCIIISVLVGMALTAPISSVAICVAISIGNVPLAAYAALIGCSTQMVGFALQTAYDNKWGSVIAVGIGTSMLQFKNIVRKPLIWLPTIIASAILGPFAMIMPIKDAATYAEKEFISSLSVAGGMGTSGLVGPLNVFAANDYNWILILEVIAFCIILPIILVFLIDFIFRKLGWIKKGDLSLSSDL